MSAITLTVPLWVCLVCGSIMITMIGHTIGAQRFEWRNNYAGS